VQEPILTGTLQDSVVVPDLDDALRTYVDDHGIGP
jgi:hypothetical protein